MDLDSLIDKIVEYKGESKIPYIERFSKKWISSVVEEIQEIQSIEKKLMIYDKKGVDIFSFVRVFLNVIHHEEDETLYLTVALIDLFRNICDAYDLETFVKSKDILNYLVDNFLARTNQPHIVPKRKLPDQKMFNTEPSRIREIDLEAPIVYGDIEDNIKRLQKTKMTCDSTDHKNNVIKKACFASEVKKMFVLDSLSDNICIYNLNCVLEKRVTPKSAKDKKDVVILDFCWSSPQLRLGATLKDFSLIFWEAEDNYTFEKTFSIVNYVTDHQAKIWYIEFLNLWITTDRTNSLHVWDIASETKMYSLTSPHIKSIILDVIPIQMLKLVAVSSLDRMITIWNFKDRRVVMKLDLTLGGIHTMFWSNHYQVLVTAGFENIIKVWDLNATSLDTSLVGKLIGHISMISAVDHIENTPMIVSADDSGHIKVWDIRSLKCIQTVQLDARIPINKLIGVYDYGKIAFIGARLHFMEFEGVKPTKKALKQAEQVWPIKVEYDNMENQIILCTSKDVRILDVRNGRMKKIYAGLLESEEDDISAFRFLHHNKNFLLGDDRGHLGIYNTSTGEKVKSLAPHDNEVTGLKVDYQNKLIISSSIGSVVHIQKESKNGHQIMRKIENMHYGKELNLLEVSVYHSLIISASSNNSVYVWDYEDARVIADIQIFSNSEPTCIHIINQYAIIIIADSLGKVHFLHFKRREASYISFVKIAELDINSKRVPTPSNDQDSLPQTFVNKIFVDFELDENEIKAKSCFMYFSTNKGDLRIYNILEIIQHRSIIPVPHANTKANYNCYRIIEEDFLEMVQKYKIYVFNFEAPDGRDFFHTSVSDLNTFPSLDSLLVNEVKAHNDILTVLSTALFSDKRLITASLDSYIKIWTLDGILLGSLNINHPLPIEWNSNISGSTKHKQKIFYALKILDGILRKNKTEMFLNEEKKISVNAFLEKLHNIDSMEGLESKPFIPENTNTISSKKNKIILMKDEYTPRDIQFQKAKKIYQQELRGHSLKQMETLNRLVKAQKAMTERTRQETHPYKETKNFDRQAEDERAKQEFMHFLLNDVRDGNKRRFETLESNPLAKKLEKSVAISATQQVKRENFDTNADSPRSVYSLQKSRYPKTNETSLKGTMIASSENQSFSKKLSHHMNPTSLSIKPISVHDGSETPSPRSPRLLNQLSLKPSTQKPMVEDKPITKRDFYLYAKRKIDTGNELVLPPLSNSGSTKSSLAITSSDRKSQKKNFCQIINKLNEAKKKSKYTLGGSYQLKPIFKSPRDDDSQDPSSSSRSKIDEPTYNHIQQRSHADFLPCSSFETGRKKDNYASFLDELKDTRRQVEESWNLSADRALPKPSATKTTLNQISKTNRSLNSNQYQLFGGRPSLKLAGKLSIPISGDSFDMNTVFNATSTHSLTNQLKSLKNLDNDYYNI